MGLKEEWDQPAEWTETEERLFVKNEEEIRWAYTRWSGEKTVEPLMMTVLSKRLEAIALQMTNTTLRAARSGVMNLARDFSCSIVTGDGRMLFVAEGQPVHIANSDFVVQSLLKLFRDDIQEGDAFLVNSPHWGNTHHADHTIIVPVFFENEIMFFSSVRGHQADCGNSLATTYMPFAKDLYEEGAIDWPVVRVQRDYQDIADVVRMGRMRIRVPEQWYGDHLAQIGACRVAERRLRQLCAREGKDYVRMFIEQYMDYGEACVVEEIRKLPRVQLEYSTRHDPVPGVAEEGIPVKIKLNIEPDEGYIYIDVSDNMDSVPGGMNLSRATTRASATQGILNNLNPDIPHNDGTFKRLPVRMARNKVVGYSEHPRCMSVATTNVSDCLANAGSAIFSKLGETHGIAEQGVGMTFAPVISGSDWRRGGAPYCNQLIPGSNGGGGLFEHDGFLTIGLPVCGGIISIDSVEIDELKYPILFKCRYNRQDGGGAGRWRGATGQRIEIVQRGRAPGEYAIVADGHDNPPKGIHGGRNGTRSELWKYPLSDLGELWESEKWKKERKTDLPKFGSHSLTPEQEVLVMEACGGAGFGDPLERDPEKVRWDAREEYISLEAVRDIYGVVLDTGPEQFAVDYPATEKLREDLRSNRSG